MPDKQYLMRTWYRTDGADPKFPDYVGAFSVTIPKWPEGEARIVAVDWSEPGMVEVTWLQWGESPARIPPKPSG